jgi:hypothetical protein
MNQTNTRVDPDAKDRVRASEFAAAACIHRSTVDSYRRRGWISAWPLPSGQFRYSLAEAYALRDGEPFTPAVA